MEKMLDMTSDMLIPAGASFSIYALAEKQFVPETILVTEEVGRAFALDAIFAGVDLVLGVRHRFPMAAFVKDAEAPPFKSIIMRPGMDFMLQLTNTSDAPRVFSCEVLGRPDSEATPPDSGIANWATFREPTD